jgi:hypothetical protein
MDTLSFSLRALISARKDGEYIELFIKGRHCLPGKNTVTSHPHSSWLLHCRTLHNNWALRIRSPGVVLQRIHIRPRRPRNPMLGILPHTGKTPALNRAIRGMTHPRRTRTPSISISVDLLKACPWSRALTHLVRPADQVHIVFLEESRDHIRSKRKRYSSVILRPASDVLVRI